MGSEKLTQSEQEESFRSSLRDLVVIADKLAPHCKTVDELVAMVNHGIENEGQTRLLMSLMIQGKK